MNLIDITGVILTLKSRRNSELLPINDRENSVIYAKRLMCLFLKRTIESVFWRVRIPKWSFLTDMPRQTEK